MEYSVVRMCKGDFIESVWQQDTWPRLSSDHTMDTPGSILFKDAGRLEQKRDGKVPFDAGCKCRSVLRLQTLG